MTSFMPRSWSPLRAAIILASLAPGCSSSTDSNGSQSGADFIRFQASGVQVQFVDQVASPVGAVLAPAANGFTLNVTGGSAPTASPFSNIQLTVIDFSPITTKTYAGFTVGGGGTFTSTSITYNVGSTGYDNTAAGTSTDVQITITAITSTTVIGVFSGTVKSKGGATVTIVGGSFQAKRL